jgi:O-antigen/teichoic acid export membrane protein
LKNEIKWGIILNYLYIGILTFSSLILMPYMTNAFGVAMYGVYSFAFTTMSLFAIADFGIAMPVINNIVKFKTRKDRKGLENYLFSTLFTYLALAAVAFSICLVIYFNSPVWFSFKFSPEEILFFRRMFLVAMGNCVLTFLISYFFSIVTAYSRIMFSRICNIVKSVLRVTLILALLQFSASPYFVFYIDLSISAAMVIAYAIYSFKLGARIKFYFVDKLHIKDTLRSMSVSYGMVISDNYYWTCCPLIIAALVSPSDLTLYNVGTTFCNVYAQLSATLSHLRMPRLAELWLDKEQPEVFRKYVLSSGRLQAGILGLILTGFILAGRVFLRLWLGASVGDATITSYLIGLIMMSAMFFPQSQSMLEVSMYAQNKYSARTVILMLNAVISSLLLLPAVKAFGLLGAAMTLAASIFVFNFLSMNLYYSKIYRHVKEFVSKVLLKTLLCIAVSSAIGLGIIQQNPSSIFLNIAGTFVGVLAYGALSYYLLYRSNQKENAALPDSPAEGT